MYNRVLTNEDISNCRDILDQEKWDKNGFNSSFWDKDNAMVKWVTILEEFKSIGKNNLKVIDLGSAFGCVPHIIASWGNDVTGIDLNSVDHWCPKGLSKMIIGDALYELKQMEDASVDVVIDSCSVHCFDPVWGWGIENWGWKNIADEVYRVLKPKGRLISSTDVTLIPDPGEFISPENLIKIIESSGLKLTSKYQKEYEHIEYSPIWQDYERLFIATLSFYKPNQSMTKAFTIKAKFPIKSYVIDKWKEDLIKDIRTHSHIDDMDGNVMSHPLGYSHTFDENGNVIYPTEVTDCNKLALLQTFMRVRDNAKSILEIGIGRNGEGSFAHIFFNNKKDETIYVGIDVEDRSFLNDSGKNIYTIMADSSNYSENIFKFRELGVEKFDFIFIDGWHSINQVLRDWEYTNLLADGGIVGFHDTSCHPGPHYFINALDESKWVVQKNLCPNDWGIGFAWKK